MSPAPPTGAESGAPEGGIALLRRRSRTFSWGARLLPADARADATRVYAFCRIADDAADEAPDPDAAAQSVDALARDLDRAHPEHPFVADWRRVALARGIDVEVARELLRGVGSDAGTVRIADEAELVRYSYRVAGTVGLMMCGVLGARPGARAFAVDLGIAMQITNICRDVAEDARLGRVYLPGTWLRDEGLAAGDVLGGDPPRPALARVLKRALARADDYYRSGMAGIHLLPPTARWGILTAARAYRAIGAALARQGCDPFAGRARVSGPRKFGHAALAAVAAVALSLPLSPRPRHDPGLHLNLRGLPGVDASPPALPTVGSPGHPAGDPAAEAIGVDRLPSCPESPNCVSTEADPSDTRHHAAPLDLRGDPAQARERLKRIVLAMPRARLVEESGDHLHFTFTSRLFRFVDDVDFLVDPETGTIRFRSASRVGYGDLGANRKRMEALRARWEAEEER